MNRLTISSATKIAAVIGDPISHSLSPKLHNFLLEKFDIDGIYLPLHIKARNLEQCLRAFAVSGLAGCNITLPHKEAALKICDNLTEAAKNIGAVNTIVIDEKDRLCGDNSDHSGFIKNIQLYQKNFGFCGNNAVLLGAGGAGRAICYALIKEKMRNVVIINRDLSRAKIMADDFAALAKQNGCSLEIADWQQLNKFLPECDLLINSTSLGMQGQSPLNIDLWPLPKSALVTDIIYKPLMTQLLLAAQNNGNPIVTGIGMLIQQALVGFEKWYQFPVNMTFTLAEELRHHLIRS